MLTLQPERLTLKPGDTLLDLGCGEGRHCLGLYFRTLLGDLSPTLHYLGIDISPQDLHTAASRQRDLDIPLNQRAALHFVQSDGLALPLADHSIDHVICSEVLEHIPDFDAMLKEIHRVLKPGGSLCVSVPRAWPERVCWWLEARYHQVEGGHIRIFHRQALKQHLHQIGFDIFWEHGAHALHVPYWWLRCLFWDRDDSFWPLRLYHRFLVWDLFHTPWLTRTLDTLLNPIMGKSVVFYSIKRRT